MKGTAIQGERALIRSMESSPVSGFIAAVAAATAAATAAKRVTWPEREIRLKPASYLNSSLLLDLVRS